jgi:hypothetical protein
MEGNMGAYRLTAIIIAFAVICESAAPQPPSVFDGNMFDVRVTCAAEAEHQDRWRSPRIDEMILTAGARVSGRIQLLERMPKAKYTSNIAILAQSKDGKNFSEFAFYECENGRSVCFSAAHVWVDERREAPVSALGVFDSQQKIPFRIHFNGPRQWVFGYGSPTVRVVKVDFPYEVDRLWVRCVSGKGWASFDLPVDLTS